MRVWLAFCFTFGLALASLKEAPISEKQKLVLQNTVKALLDFKNVPRPADAIKPLSRTANAASKYMRKLFENFDSGVQGNIARSLSPSTATLNGQPVLLFDLGTIKRNEMVIDAQLHYNLRAGRKRARRRVQCAALWPSGARVALRLVETHQKWLSFDARNAVRGALNNRSAPAFFGVECARTLRKSKLSKIMSPNTVMNRHTPFLLIQSEADEVVDKQQVINAVLENRPKRSADFYTYKDPPAVVDKTQLFSHVKTYLSQGPELFQTKKEIRKLRKRKQRKGALPYPKEFGGKKDKYEFSGQKSSKTEPTVVLLGNSKSGVCAKQELYVRFKDIGWEHWVIAPKSFGAHFCAGNCDYPLGPESAPSNHALVQSIIHTIGIDSSVPAVCCAPQKMDSLSILYFDEDDNVVLKNFPKMTVSSCACL